MDMPESHEAVMKEIVLFFNNPYLLTENINEIAEGEEIFAQDKQQTINYSYDLKIKLDPAVFSSITLENLRLSIDEQLKEFGDVQSSPYHFKRNGLYSTPQLKDESKTLVELDIADQSILHLQVFTLLD